MVACLSTRESQHHGSLQPMGQMVFLSGSLTVQSINSGVPACDDTQKCLVELK